MTWYGALLAPLERWRAIHELRSMRKREASEDHWDFQGQLLKAADALDRDQKSRAIEICQRAAARFPELAIDSPVALKLFLQLQLFNEIEALLTRGLKQRPGERHCLEGLAEVAYKRRDNEEVLLRCSVLRRSHPGSPHGYRIAAAALSELGRLDEAETTLASGLKAMPNEVGLHIEYAKIAERRSDWDAAMKRWTFVRDQYGHLAGTAGMASTLAELGRHDEADTVLREILYKASSEITIWIAIAQIAEHKADWEEAARRWAVVRQRFPRSPLGYSRGFKPELEMGRPQDAEEILKKGIENVPDDLDIHIQFAWLAHHRHEWTEASRRWAIVRELFPSCKVAYERGSEALFRAGRESEALEVASRI